MADFKSTIIKDDYGNEAECTLLDQLKVAQSFRLAGGVFNDSVLDPNFYTASTAAGGTATVANGVLTVAVTTTSGSTAGVATARPGRYMGSNSNYYRANVRLGDTGTAGNIRYWGAFNGTTAPTSGFYFKLDGTTFSVCHKPIGGAEVAVSSGSFNGHTSVHQPTLNCTTYEIYYTVRRVLFTINGEVIHTFTATTSALTGELHFRANILSVNAGVGPAVSIYTQVMSISRLGEAHSNPRATNVVGVATTLLKTGPGGLHRIIVGNPAGTVTVYDNTAGSGTILVTLALAGLASPMAVEIGCEFTNGCTAVSTGASNITYIYE